MSPTVEEKPPLAADKPKVKLLVLVGAPIVAMVVGFFLWGTRLASVVTPHIYTGTVFQDSSPAPRFDGLSFSDGTPANLDQAAGKMVLVFFGYTHCPDICPTTLDTISTALTQVENSAERVEVWMISVDPERDDAQYLEQYVDHFSPSFSGLSGTQTEIDAVAAAYGVFYQIHEPDDTGEYLVDHSAQLMGIGPDGSFRIVWAPDTLADALASDINALLG